MRRTVVSQGLAYQQPMDDSGQEHHVPMLLNDGREVPKFLPDKTAFGYDVHYLQKLKHPFNTSNSHGSESLRVNISKKTKVFDASPSVIVIDSDDEGEKLPTKITFPEAFKDIQTPVPATQNTKWTQPSQPAPTKKLRMSTKVVSEEEDQGFLISQQKKTKEEDVGAIVVDPPFAVDTGQMGGLGIQMRTGGIEDLNEILELMEEIGEIEPSQKERKKNFEKGKVVDGEREALVELLNNENQMTTGVTGVLCSGMKSSHYDEYNEGHFSILKQLGTGSYGSVDLCRDNATTKEFVLKKVQKDFKVGEVVVLLYLEHENITTLYGYIKRDSVSEILMEYAGTNLLNFVLKRQTMEETLIWSMTTQCLSALKYLDEHQIKHLDLKPENICVTEDLKIKITDFGSANVGDQEQDYQGWTSEYMAPEMCRAFLKSRYPSVFKNETEDFSLTGKVDVFAFGLVLQFMLEKTHTQMKFYTNGASSYTNVEDVNKLRLNIIIANARDPDMVLKLMLTDKGSTAIKELLKGLLQGVPKNRLSAEQGLLKIEAMKRKNMIPCFPLSEARLEASTKVTSFCRRRSRQLSTMTSVCSNTSQMEEPMSPGPMKAPRKGRKRMAPYEPEEPKPVMVDNSLLGNVPDFSMLQA
eukprot:XP_011416981.2 PREDICTED: probable serine/threonine-protein kinase MARK-B [Crassostrea gigas]